MSTKAVTATKISSAEDLRFDAAIAELGKTKRCCVTVLENLIAGTDYARPDDSKEPLDVVLPEWLIGKAANRVWQHCVDAGYTARVDFRVEVENGKAKESFAISVHRPHNPKHICGADYAHKMLQQTARKAARLIKLGVLPELDILHAGDKPDDESYRVQIRAAAKFLGVTIKEVRLDEHPTPNDLADRLGRLNADGSVTGVLVQTIRDAAVDNIIRSTLMTRKDCEMVDRTHMSELIIAAPGVEVGAPCTAMSARALLHEGFGGAANVRGKLIVIINASAVIGLPAAILLLKTDGATIAVCNRDTPPELRKWLTGRADGIIIGTGLRGLLAAEDINPGAIVVDCGIINLNGRIVGDVDLEAVMAVVGMITPVPGGVGPVTTAMLLRSLIDQAWAFHSAETVG